MEPEQKSQHTEKTWTGFLYSLFGITLPFILSFLGMCIIKKYEHVIAFIDDGQILLFAAGLLSGAYYLLRDDQNQMALKKSELKLDRILSHLIMLFLIVSSVMYAIIYSIGIAHPQVDIINVDFIRGMSVFLFVFAAYSAYSSIYIDFLKVYPIIDVKKESTKGVKDILDNL